MKRSWKAGALAFWLFPATALLHAGVINSGSLSLTQFQITASGGTVTLMSPVTATVFAQALDSLGALDQNFNSADNAALLAVSGHSASSCGSHQ